MLAGDHCPESSGHPGDRHALLLCQTQVKAEDAETSPGHSSLGNVEAPGEGAFIPALVLGFWLTMNLARPPLFLLEEPWELCL